jgi:two-component sensor histidine kinase/DNA-binding NarL/FixJ family response regulator
MTQPVPILLVDDRPENLMVLQSVLEAPDLRLVTARDGQEGLLMLLKEEFAAVVLDVELPGANGLEVARLVRQRQRTSRIPIVFLTAHRGTEDDAMAGYDAGGVDYLVKPVIPSVLRCKIAVFADLFRKSRALAEEVTMRQHTEDLLRLARDGLEYKVGQRTRELAEANEALRRSLAEKDALLQEVHHRVKNNMAVISSLLNLQAQSLPDSASRLPLEESRDRIKSMAFIHERLYQSRNLSAIEFGAYAKELAELLVRAYSTRANVHLEAEVDAVTLNIDTAIPAGLILNELICNALKHAFPARRHGRMVVRFLAGPDDRFTLSVADNGVGLAHTPDDTGRARPETFGYKLIRLLSQQLQATLVQRCHHGTEVTVTFKQIRKSNTSPGLLAAPSAA